MTQRANSATRVRCREPFQEGTPPPERGALTQKVLGNARRLTELLPRAPPAPSGTPSCAELLSPSTATLSGQQPHPRALSPTGESRWPPAAPVARRGPHTPCCLQLLPGCDFPGMKPPAGTARGGGNPFPALRGKLRSAGIQHPNHGTSWQRRLQTPLMHQHPSSRTHPTPGSRWEFPARLHKHHLQLNPFSPRHQRAWERNPQPWGRPRRAKQALPFRSALGRTRLGFSDPS